MRTRIIGGALVLSVLACTQVSAADRTFGDGDLPEHLTVYDVDGDGVLSEEEKQAMKDARHDRRKDLIAKCDRDGDGVLSDEEKEACRDALRDRIRERRIERFKEADTDNDGFLSFTEFSAIPAVMKLAEEYPDKPALIFARLDTDDDELVSLEEFLAHLKHRRHHRHHRNGGGDGDGGGENSGDV